MFLGKAHANPDATATVSLVLPSKSSLAAGVQATLCKSPLLACSSTADSVQVFDRCLRPLVRVQFLPIPHLPCMRAPPPPCARRSVWPRLQPGSNLFFLCRRARAGWWCAR